VTLPDIRVLHVSSTERLKKGFMAFIEMFLKASTELNLSESQINARRPKFPFEFVLEYIGPSA
jgi:hypothetical protein